MKLYLKNQSFNSLLISGLVFLLFSCDWGGRNNFKLYSADRKQCVTIITESNTRYIINGKHNSIPETGYIKLDISRITELRDAIGVCWNKGKYEWEIVNSNAEIIETRLDTLKYKFNTSWEENERGIPNQTKYIQQNCDVLDIEYMKFFPNTGKVILEN